MEESVIQNVLRFYGESGSLSTGNLENFLRLITSRRALSVDADANPLKNTEVMKTRPVSDTSTFRLSLSVRSFFPL